MRHVVLMLLCIMMLGCGGSRAVFAEHADEAAMRTAAQFVIHVIDQDASINQVVCALPQEVNMEQTVADRFAEENAATLGDQLHLTVTLDGGLALIDVCGLPPLASAGAEEALLGAICDTMSQFSSLERIRFRFDGETLPELPHGTRCFQDFPIDESG